ncbi:MAG: hypothetical protein O3B84_06660 [Chloroflexi bacterium]|nr:hypothetical protein [Chloroflexota bacterium]
MKSYGTFARALPVPTNLMVIALWLVGWTVVAGGLALLNPQTTETEMASALPRLLRLWLGTLLFPAGIGLWCGGLALAATAATRDEERHNDSA